MLMPSLDALMSHCVSSCPHLDCEGKLIILFCYKSSSSEKKKIRFVEAFIALPVKQSSANEAEPALNTWIKAEPETR